MPLVVVFNFVVAEHALVGSKVSVIGASSFVAEIIVNVSACTHTSAVQRSKKT